MVNKKKRIPWNKGMKGVYYLWGKKLNPMKGKKSPFKGKKHTIKAKRLIGEKAKGNKRWLGKEHTKETKEKMSKNQQGSKNNLWRGGKLKTGAGYFKIYSPTHPRKDNSGYVFEHRLIMEKKLGRSLTPEEVIHHTNEIRDDNRIENLELFKSKGNHKRFHLQKNRERLLKLEKENVKLKRMLGMKENV